MVKHGRMSHILHIIYKRHYYTKASHPYFPKYDRFLGKHLITKIMALKDVVNKKRGKAKLNKAKSVGRIGKECG
jgi:hypothetical protein